MRLLDPGLRAYVKVPATSANLGPGFDALGLALDWFDTSKVTTTNSGFTFDLSGPQSKSLSRGKDHLVVATLLGALEELGAQVSGLHFESEPTIPLARGLGSSSAAIVAGLLLAWDLANPGEPLDRQWAFTHAYNLEGHGDNVGPATMGGFTITWSTQFEGAGDSVARVQTSPVRADIRALALIPSFELQTDSARAVLPVAIPMADAIANAARSALLVHAMADDPSLLFDATADRVHQNYRADLSPESFSLLSKLRDEGFAAVISGAGPTVLVLHQEKQTEALLRSVANHDPARSFASRVLRAGEGAQILRAE